MLHFHAGQEHWQIRTSDNLLKVGRRHIDSEGSVYFIIIGDDERIYNADEVEFAARIDPSWENVAWPGNEHYRKDSPERKRRPCGSNILTFNGRIKFRCGKFT